MKRNQEMKKTMYAPEHFTKPIIFLEYFMHDQLSNYFDTILSSYQCRLRKGYSTQYPL